MGITEELLAGLPDGRVVDVSIGLHWTAVVVEQGGERSCGLGATLRPDGHHSTPLVPQAGHLAELPARELAGFALSDNMTLRSIGFAALNALLPRQPEMWTDENAEAVLVERGAGKTVAMVGHFPFVERLRPRVGTLHVLEQHPQPGDLPADAAPDVLPSADVVAITGMTLLNGSLEGLLKLCAADAAVLLLGPSTPLSPVLFDYGVTTIAGAVVTSIEPLLRTVRQGANFRQAHKAGVRLVTIVKQ